MELKHADQNVFNLSFFVDMNAKLKLEATGKIRVYNGKISFDYGANDNIIGSINENSGEIITLHRNMVPLYKRKVDNTLYISNDVCELLFHGETIDIKKLTLLEAERNEARNIFANLFHGISLLMPSSKYRIKAEGGSVDIEWMDIDFNERPAITRDEFLEYLIEQYKSRYESVDEICFGLSGGYDSRLELAVLSYLNKKIHCFHYVTAPREAKIAKKAANIVKGSFQQYNSSQMAREGWRLIRELGYNTRWDGFFAPGLLSSAGLVTEVQKNFLYKEMLLINTIPYKSKLCNCHNIANMWKEINLISFDYAPIASEIESENWFRSNKINAIVEKTDNKSKNMSIDVTYPFFYKGARNVAARIAPFYENGMFSLSGEKTTREMFASLLRKHKEGNAFLEFAISKLNPELAALPYVTSSMDTYERQFGKISKLKGAKRLLKRFSYKGVHEALNWYKEQDVAMMLEQLPELRESALRAKGKGALCIAQICCFLAMCYEKKRVKYSVK